MMIGGRIREENKNNNDISLLSLFATPVMEVQLDLDLEKLTEFAFQIQNKDKKGVQMSNRSGGWQSNRIHREKHEEFVKLKKEINHYLQIYYSKVFGGMKFKEDKNIIFSIVEMWVNINEKHQYNEWHVHPQCTLSGAYYIKHDSSSENGDIIFKHPNNLYMSFAHWPQEMIENTNVVSSDLVGITSNPNMLLIFPAWLEHKVDANLKNDSRISVSFNAVPLLETK